MAAGSFEALAQQFRRLTGQDNRKAVLGDAGGVIYEPGRPGYVRVRFAAADGQYTAYTVVRMRGVLEVNPGDAVTIGYDEDDELAVIGIDFAGQIRQGRNPLVANAADRRNTAWVSQSQILTAYCHPVGTPSTDSTEVAVRAWIYIQDGTAHAFLGERVDLASYIPGGSDQHLVAGLFLKSDDTIEVVTSTAQSIAAPLGIADVQECVDGASSEARAIWFWRLYSGQTRVVDADSWLDGRQILNVSGVGARAGFFPNVITGTFTVPDGYNAVAYGHIDATGGRLVIAGTARVRILP